MVAGHVVLPLGLLHTHPLLVEAGSAASEELPGFAVCKTESGLLDQYIATSCRGSVCLIGECPVLALVFHYLLWVCDVLAQKIWNVECVRSGSVDPSAFSKDPDRGLDRDVESSGSPPEVVHLAVVNP